MEILLLQFKWDFHLDKLEAVQMDRNFDLTKSVAICFNFAACHETIAGLQRTDSLNIIGLLENLKHSFSCVVNVFSNACHISYKRGAKRRHTHFNSGKIWNLHDRTSK